MIKLIMWSGGVDSTGLLFKTLQEYKESTIILHHINLRNISTHRNEAEDQAVKDMVKYIHKHYDNILFTASSFHYEAKGMKLTDTFVVAYIASMVAYDFLYVWFNDTGEYPEIEAMIAWERTEEEIEGPRAEYNEIKMQENFNLAFNDFDKRGIPAPKLTIAFNEKVGYIGKQKTYDYIPDEIKHLVTSCRHPEVIGSKFAPCGICKPCKTNKKSMGIV